MASFGRVMNLVQTFSSFLHKTNKNDDDVPPDVPPDVSPDVPSDFICCICREVMTEPVTISTGLTYDAKCITEWFGSGQLICPHSMKTLQNLDMVPNHTLSNQIAEWQNKTVSPHSFVCRSSEQTLIENCVSGFEHQKDILDQNEILGVTCDLLDLSRRSNQVRVVIGEAGAIPHLVKLMNSEDQRVQGYSLKAILNLSVTFKNKSIIISAGGIQEAVQAMRSAHSAHVISDYASGIIFSLSVTNEGKKLIGSCGGIGPLVRLIESQNENAQKYAVLALHNVLSLSSNVPIALDEGIVGTLMCQIGSCFSDILEECLMVLSCIVSYNETHDRLYAENDPVYPLVKVIRTGFEMNQEYAVSILLSMCKYDETYIGRAKGADVQTALSELSSDKGKELARVMMDVISTDTLKRKRATHDDHGSGPTPKRQFNTQSNIE